MPADPAAIGGFASLSAAARGYRVWLTTDALPLWARVGVDPATGAFREGLRTSGEAYDPRRRTRVQSRQVFVFASAACDGFWPQGLMIARRGWAAFQRTHQRADGLYLAESGPGGTITDATPRLYEQAFVLLALSALQRADPSADWTTQALNLQERLGPFRHALGGFREAGREPFQANAQMHLFEAALAWDAAAPNSTWSELADEIAALALARLIDPVSGVLHEFFESDWTPRRGNAGLIEPGHHFEWAWLLDAWGKARGHAAGCSTARRLFEVGASGFDAQRHVAVNALWEDLTIRDAGARLWPQTEQLRAALAFGDDVRALAAANGLSRYLQTPAPGTWHERMRPDGGFVDEPAPATSLYHLYGAVRALCEPSRRAAEAC